MRVCDSCKTELAGPKGHGFVVQQGKAVFCGYCAFPESQKFRDAFIQKTFGVSPARKSFVPPARRLSKPSAQRPPWRQVSPEQR